MRSKVTTWGTKSSYANVGIYIDRDGQFISDMQISDTMIGNPNEAYIYRAATGILVLASQYHKALYTGVLSWTITF